MAGDWIKMVHGLDTAPEVIQVAGAIDTSREFVVGALYRLWCWADQHTEDGRLPGVSLAFVDAYLGVDEIASELVTVGWLVVDKFGLVIPKFERHNSKPAKQRANTNRRVKRLRDNDAQPPSVDAGNAGSVTEALQVDGYGNGASVTEALPEIEKRREEVISITDDEKSVSGVVGSPDDGRAFLVLWDVWPAHRRMNRRQAEAAWADAVTRAPPDKILAAGKAFAKSPKGQSEFCTSLAKWLARDAFADDPASWTQGKRPPKKPDKAADRSRVLYQQFRELQTALADLAVDSDAWKETRAEMDRLSTELDKVTA